jgi:hypothetical protein
MLPSAVTLIQCDALTAILPKASYDIVYVSTVSSSILGENFQELLAQCLWSLVTPGGNVLWYDFVYNNPKNPDVRDVNLNPIGRLFLDGELRSRRVTLAPPISRLVVKLHRQLYTFLIVSPFFAPIFFATFRKRLIDE